MTAHARVRANLRRVASPRPTRTDAARNYDAIVAAAREEFAENGMDASLKAVARRAGVGIATLYRNFPTRAGLLEAVYIDDVVDTVTALFRTAESGATARREPDEPAPEAAEPSAGERDEQACHGGESVRKRDEQSRQTDESAREQDERSSQNGESAGRRGGGWGTGWTGSPGPLPTILRCARCSPPDRPPCRRAGRRWARPSPGCWQRPGGPCPSGGG
ncbi:helix-turn-helix domain-containing protein [Streptomyces sp. HC307]|uniref:helix-turn-helix domain-containing protein n=1 Tax=Streptomyces flavusporus TaxID=3385496 RepID=UPI0039170C4B